MARSTDRFTGAVAACLVLLVMLGAGCGSGTGDATATIPATERPEAAQEIPGAPVLPGSMEDAGEQQTQVEEALPGSFRIRVIWRVRYRDGGLEELLIEETRIREPFSSRSLLQVQGLANEERLEVVQVEHERWTGVGTSWVTDLAEIPDWRGEIGTLLWPGDVELDGEASVLGEELANGVETLHYVWDEKPNGLVWVEAVQASFGLAADVRELVFLGEDLWLASEPGLEGAVVRLSRRAQGMDAEREAVEIVEIRDLMDLNSAAEVTLPTLGSLALANLLTSRGGTVLSAADADTGSTVIIAVDDDPDAVVEHYWELLAAEGWTLEPESHSGETAVLSGSRQGEELLMLVDPLPDGGSRVTVSVSAGR